MDVMTQLFSALFLILLYMVYSEYLCATLVQDPSGSQSDCLECFVRDLLNLVCWMRRSG